LTLPRKDPLAPKPEQSVPQRAVRIEKIVEGDLQEQIDASIPASTLPDHSILAHDNAYALTVAGGLSVVIAGGRAQLDHVVYEHGPTAFSLTASTTNYISISGTGTLTASTSAFSSGQIPLWQVTTDASSVGGQIDKRAVFARGGGGGGGTLDDAYDFGSVGGGRIIFTTDGPVRLENTEADALPNLEIARSATDINTQPAIWVRATTSAQPEMAIDGNSLGFGPGLATAPDIWFTREATGVAGFHNNGTVGQTVEFKSVTTPSAPGGNISRMYNRVFGTQSAMFLKDQNGREYGPLGYKMAGTVFGRGAAGGMESSQSATWSDGLWGTLAPAASWTAPGTPSMGNSTGSGGGRYADFASGAVSGNDAGIESQTVFWANKGDAYLFRFELPSSSLVRYFVGIAAQTLTTMVGADNPGTNHLGIQYSTPRGDTTWKFTERGTGSQVVTDTTLGMGVTAMYLQVLTGTITQMILLDAGMTVLATRSVGALNKPGGSTLVRMIAGCETQTNAAKSVRVYQMAHHATEA